MKGDFTRDTFDLTKHFSRVLQQQGRVQVDADANEQTAILLHYIRTLAADLIGPFAGPAGPDYGFEISIIPKDDKSFNIGKGRYYVDGILCENETVASYAKQKNFPFPEELLPNKDYLVYLDVWERHVTTLEDDDIREKALGGPDTATRAQVVWQVKVWYENGGLKAPSELNPNDIINAWSQWVHLWQPNTIGCLKAGIKPLDLPNDACHIAPDAKYRGLENQLYRVEIHSPGKDKSATFKWSRDNGSVATRIVEGSFAETSCLVESSRGFEPGNWLEFTNDGQELRGEPGTLVQLNTLENDVLSLKSEPKQQGTPNTNEKWPTKVRRWDHVATKTTHLAKDNAVPITEGTADKDWIALEDGLQIQFQPGATRYRTGDYWLIPARVATGDIEWPFQLDEKTGLPAKDGSGRLIRDHKPPNGIRHHYAPLAILNLSGDGNLTPIIITFSPVTLHQGLS